MNSSRQISICCYKELNMALFLYENIFVIVLNTYHMLYNNLKICAIFIDIRMNSNLSKKLTKI